MPSASPAFGVEMSTDKMSVDIYGGRGQRDRCSQGGATLKEITLPENTLVMMVYRDGDYFVPQGNTES